jgi:hypothetical protein
LLKYIKIIAVNITANILYTAYSPLFFIIITGNITPNSPNIGIPIDDVKYIIYNVYAKSQILLGFFAFIVNARMIGIRSILFSHL